MRDTILNFLWSNEVEVAVYILAWVFVAYWFCRGVDAVLRSIQKDER